MRRKGTVGRQSEKDPGSWLVVFGVKTDDLVNLIAREVGSGAEVGIAHHIQIGESGQAQRLAQAAASGASRSKIRSVL